MNDEDVNAGLLNPDPEQPHNCIDHLQLQQHEWTEPHGEHCYQEWWIYSWCGEEFIAA